MGKVSGDMVEITFNHPTVGSGTLYCQVNQDIQVDYGGIRNEDDDDSMTGDGQRIYKKRRRGWSLEAPPINWDMTEGDELTKLSDLSASPVEAEFTFQSITGAIWAGRGQPLGDVIGNASTGLIPIKFGGSGRLRSIG